MNSKGDESIQFNLTRLRVVCCVLHFNGTIFNDSLSHQMIQVNVQVRMSENRDNLFEPLL